MAMNLIFFFILVPCDLLRVMCAAVVVAIAVRVKIVYLSLWFYFEIKPGALFCFSNQTRSGHLSYVKLW